MRKFVLSCLILIFISNVFSKQVDETTARKVAKTYLNFESKNKNINLTGLSLADRYIDRESLIKNNSSEVIYFYIFNLLGSKGFIIVSGDDNVEPVLGYSTEVNYDTNNLSPEFKYWLDQYKLEIKSVIENNVKASDELIQKWNEMINGTYTLQKTNKKSKSPLMKTKWNQSPYYNDLCPPDASCNCLCPTGCTATAMAQILKYWNYPKTGTGFNKYFTSKYGVLSANFGGTSYDWSGMPDNVNSKNMPVATLMYNCGVSVNMIFGPDASGSWVIASDNPVCAQTAYAKYFGYDSVSIQGLKRSEYSDSIWTGMLENELDNKRPVQYAGWDSQGGHTFIFDGYDTGDYFHVNWGWGGYNNGYFKINSLNPLPFNFTKNQEALIGIQPVTTKKTNNSFVNISQHKVCPNNTIYFDAWGDAVSYIWNYGDGSVDSNVSVANHKYDTTGTFPVWIKMTYNSGKDTTFYDTIYVVNNLSFSQFNSQITINPIRSCPNSSVEFKAQGTAYSFKWDFGDGSQSANNSYAEHEYNTTGVFLAKLKITNECGIDTNIFRNIIVDTNAPVANIGYQILPNPVCPNSIVDFYAWGNAVSFDWNFGDGSSFSDKAHSKHLFTLPGNYPVSVKMINSCGHDTIITDTVRIVTNLTPKDAVFSFNPVDACPNSIINFTASGGILYHWDFGDGSPAMENAEPYHIYSNPGKYPVSVKVSNSCGNDTTLYDTVRVGNKSAFINVMMILSSNSVCPNSNVWFYSFGDAYTYIWNFGDGSPEFNNQFANHSYSATGKYNISLKIINHCGNDTTLFQTISVVNNLMPERPYLYMSPNPVCPKDTVNFQLSGNADTYSWNFADGSPLVYNNYGASHAFTNAGTYFIYIKATNACGKTSGFRYTLNVKDDVPITNIRYDISPKKVCPNDEVTFHVNGNASAFEWEFGDDTPPVISNDAKHMFSSAGSYSITLKATNKCGRDTTITDTVQVSETAIPDPNDFKSTVSSNEACPGDTIIFSVRPVHYGKYLWDFGDGSSDSATVEMLDGSGNLNDIVKHVYLSSGYYNVGFKLTNKCGSNYTNMFPVLISNNSPVNGNFWWVNSSYINSNIAFYASGGSFYKWNFGDGSPDITTNTFPLIHSYSKVGTFTVSVIITNSCGNSRTYQNNIFVGVNGVTENSVQENMFKIYPNPNVGVFTLEFEKAENNASALEILNLFGQIIYSRQFNNIYKTTELINLSGISKGLYFVRMQTKNNSFVKKLIIE